jgi:hypothetical protein
MTARAEALGTVSAVTRVFSKIFLMLAGIAMSLALSFWWISSSDTGGSVTDTARVLLDDPAARAAIIERVTPLASEASGLSEAEVRLKLQELSTEDILGGISPALTAETTNSAAIPAEVESLLPAEEMSDLNIPGLALLESLGSLQHLTAKLVLLALVAAAAAVYLSGSRRLALSRLSRKWFTSSAGILFFALALPRLLGYSERLEFVLLRAWLSRSRDLRFPAAILVLSLLVFLFSRRQLRKEASSEEMPSTAPSPQ